HRYTVDEKRDLLKKVSITNNIYQVAKGAGVDESNLKRWAKQLAKDPTNFGKNLRSVKSGKRTKQPLMEEELVKDMMSLREKRLAITWQMLVERAKMYCEEHSINNMKFSNGWLYSFLKRNKIVK